MDGNGYGIEYFQMTDVSMSISTPRLGSWVSREYPSYVEVVVV